MKNAFICPFHGGLHDLIDMAEAAHFILVAL